MTPDAHLPVYATGVWVGEPGEVFKLSKYFLTKGTADDFRAMAEDRALIVRSMGMICLALTAGDEAVPMVKARIRSQDSFQCVPFGCIVGHWTEGKLARQLLHGPSFLGHAHHDPLLPERPTSR